MNDLISRSDFKKMLVKQFAGSGTHEDDTKEMDDWNCCLARIIPENKKVLRCINQATQRCVISGGSFIGHGKQYNK